MAKKRAAAPPKTQYQKDLARWGKAYAEGAERMRRNAARRTTPVTAPATPKPQGPNTGIGPVSITQPAYLKGTLLWKNGK